MNILYYSNGTNIQVVYRCMQLIYLKEKEELKRFQYFRKALYQGDPSYVSTDEFVVEDLLYQKTAFTRS